MAKKLFFVWLLITMVIFSSISIYASTRNISGVEEEQVSHTQTEISEKQEIITAMAVQSTAVRKEDENYQKGLSAYIRYINGNVTRAEADLMVESFVKFADVYGVDEKIAMAIAQNESTYYSNATSSEDYKGLMQTGDGLARNAGYSPQQLYDPVVSIEVGIRYLSIKLEEFGDVRLALTAYNQGSGAVHSGNYSTGYADLAVARAGSIEAFLYDGGFLKES